MLDAPLCCEMTDIAEVAGADDIEVACDADDNIDDDDDEAVVDDMAVACMAVDNADDNVVAAVVDPNDPVGSIGDTSEPKLPLLHVVPEQPHVFGRNCGYG